MVLFAGVARLGGDELPYHIALQANQERNRHQNTRGLLLFSFSCLCACHAIISSVFGCLSCQCCEFCIVSLRSQVDCVASAAHAPVLVFVLQKEKKDGKVAVKEKKDAKGPKPITTPITVRPSLFDVGLLAVRVYCLWCFVCYALFSRGLERVFDLLFKCLILLLSAIIVRVG